MARKQTTTLEVVELPDGRQAIVFDAESADIILEVIDDRRWWRGAMKRAKAWGTIWGMVVAALAFLALSWPYITRVVQFFSEK